MKACSIIATLYGFEMSDEIVTRENNCKLTTKLKEKSAFAYHVGADCQHEVLLTRLIFTSRNFTPTMLAFIRTKQFSKLSTKSCSRKRWTKESSGKSSITCCLALCSHWCSLQCVVYTMIWAHPLMPFMNLKIECVIDEWGSSKHKSIPFKEDNYKWIYSQHMKSLEYFHQWTQGINILLVILWEVYNNGRQVSYEIIYTTSNQE